MDFLLNRKGDWKIENGDVVLVDKASYIRQLWLIRIRTFRGEWLLDDESGVPYIQTVYQKAKPQYIENVFRTVTAETPGVLLVQSVAILDFDRTARTIKIEVTAVIEGPEDVTFVFDGSLPGEEGEDPNFPLSIDGLSMWFDAQDLDNLVWDGTNLTLKNKAGTGSATGKGVTGEPTLLGVSPINNKRGIFFDNDDSGNDQYMEIVDTPAIKGDDGITIVVVGKHKAKTSPADTSTGLAAIDGFYAPLLQEQHLNFNYSITSGLSKLTAVAGRVGGSTATRNSSASLELTDPEIYVFKSDGAGDFYRMNVLQTASGNNIPNLSFNGDGAMGASLSGSVVGVLENFYNGYQGEVLVYDSKISDTDSTALYEHLFTKWGFDDTEVWQNVSSGEDEIIQNVSTGEDEIIQAV